ncbi:hypothetical protein OF83DRAFT_1154134 [Amylostereum chailletii]|nr:hypothetical protein OF83DRAFT_1154134 [Amylostereum chailletii]
MIVAETNPVSSKKDTAGPANREESSVLDSDSLPPPYSPPFDQSQPTSSHSHAPSIQPHGPPSDCVETPNIPAVNFLLVRERDRPIQGRYLLDLSVPPPPLSARSSDYKHLGPHNLRFETRDGKISPEIWLVAGEQATQARVSLVSRDGAINAVFHTPPPSTPRAPVRIVLENRDGTTTLALPRSFHGLLRLQTRHSRIVLSPELSALAATLSISKGTHAYFVGARGGTEDEATVVTRDGTVNVRFEDELAAGGVSDRVGGGGVHWIGSSKR